MVLDKDKILLARAVLEVHQDFTVSNGDHEVAACIFCDERSNDESHTNIKHATDCITLIAKEIVKDISGLESK
jgi:hypothetical protein